MCDRKINFCRTENREKSVVIFHKKQNPVLVKTDKLFQKQEIECK